MVEGGAALVCMQPESLLQHHFHGFHIVFFNPKLKSGTFLRTAVAGDRSPNRGLSPKLETSGHLKIETILLTAVTRKRWAEVAQAI